MGMARALLEEKQRRAKKAKKGAALRESKGPRA